MAERALSKIDKSDGCWIWRGTITDQGYGQIHESRVKGHQRHGLVAHRVVYELLVGPIPDGLHLDHLCRTRACVNPAHLEPVTLAENNRRSECPSGLNVRKTHCKRGHPLSGPNLKQNKKGRACRACHNAQKRERRKRRPISKRRNESALWNTTKLRKRA